MVAETTSLPGHGERIVHLTSVHVPFDTRIFQKECRSLAAAGFDVALIAPHSHDEVIDGVRVLAVEKPFNRKQRLRETIPAVYRRALAECGAIYHFHDPELLTVGLALRLMGNTVIFDAHELLPLQVYQKQWIPEALKMPMSKLISATYNMSSLFLDGLVAAVQPIADAIPVKPQIVLHNYPLLDELTIKDAPAYAKRPNRFVCVGGMSVIRSVREMIGAMARLDPSLEAKLDLGGPFPDEALQKEAETMSGSEATTLHGWVTRPQAATLLGQARAGLALFHPQPNHDIALPTKMLEYMSAGIPVIGGGIKTIDAVVNEHQCGLIVNPKDTNAIADAMRWIIEHPHEAEAMGQRGRQAVESKYNWETESQKLFALYRQLLDSE